MNICYNDGPYLGGIGNRDGDGRRGLVEACNGVIICDSGGAMEVGGRSLEEFCQQRNGIFGSVERGVVGSDT